ncbi:unnamed protein product [Ectocarpus sp. CCAP 1310/34]|nr:unnamed protein product [Ectocarpus sp. CCAP 1310/34]
MSLSNPLSHGLLKDLGKLAELKGRGLILDRHFETIKTHVKAGNSVAKERWDAIESAWGLKQNGIFDEGDTRLSLSSQQDASSARGAAAPSQHPPAAAAGTARRKRTIGAAAADATEESEGRVLPWEEAGPGRCWHVKVDDATGAASFVLQRKRFLDLDLESDGDTTIYRFKANAVNRLRILEDNAADLWKEEERTPLQYLEDRLKVHYSNVRQQRQLVLK